MISVQKSRTSLLSSAAFPSRGAVIAVCTAAFLASIGAACALDGAGDPLVATVGNTEIHESDLAIAERDLGRNLPAENEQGKREYLLRYLSDMILLAGAAEQEKVADEAELRRRITFARNKALMEMLLAHAAKAAVTDAALRQAYDEAVQKVGTEEETHLRTILFKIAEPKDEAASKAAEARADAAVERIRSGEDFSAVANELTDNPSGKHNGGDIGYLTRVQMGQEFADAIAALDRGAISAPIKTPFGWHVLKVEDKRTRLPPEFEKVRDKMELYVARKAQLDLVATLRSAAKIERLDKLEKPVETESAK